jgi:hypothetical protein
MSIKPFPPTPWKWRKYLVGREDMQFIHEELLSNIDDPYKIVTISVFPFGSVAILAWRASMEFSIL